MDVGLSYSTIFLFAVFSHISALDANNIRVSHDAISEDPKCAHQMGRVYHDDVITPYPPNLTGEWTSMNCEIRPGPQFLVRKYRFFEGRRFSFLQYYYVDSLCKQPAYTLLARGSYTTFQPSWLLTGATEMDYQLNHVSLMPHTNRMSGLLANKVNSSCPGYVHANWKKNHWYDIFNYVEVQDQDYPDEEGYLLVDRDCLSALSFSLHELQLIRLELRKTHHNMVKRLLLGDIHTEAGERKYYRPTGFQQPLAFIHQAPNCPVCDAISDSDEYHPPSLHRHHSRADLALVGSWFSVECETRPNGVFVTRHLSFHDNNRTWEGYYHHFLDGRCTRPQFSAYVAGKYAYGSASHLVQDAHEVDFQVLKARVNPTDVQIVKLLNTHVDGYQRCGTAEWVVNKEQDVTASKGCQVLGLELPHTEYELVRIQKKHHHMMLYLGQRQTLGNNFTPSQRPTSFQTPMVRCSDNIRAVTPTYSFHQMVQLRSLGSAANAKSMNPVLILMSIMFTTLFLMRKPNGDMMD